MKAFQQLPTVTPFNINLNERILDALFRDLADAFPYIIWIANTQSEVEYYNRYWFKYTGLSLKEAQTLGWQYIMHPDDLAPTVEKWNSHAATGTPYEITHRIRCHDGSFRRHISQAFPIRNSENLVIKWFGSSTDIENDKISALESDSGETTYEGKLKARLFILEAVNTQILQQVDERKSLNENLRFIRQQISDLTKAVGIV